jgi:hypothetical protein
MSPPPSLTTMNLIIMPSVCCIRIDCVNGVRFVKIKIYLFFFFFFEIVRIFLSHNTYMNFDDEERFGRFARNLEERSEIR